MTGGFGWVLQLDDGPPKRLEIDQVRVFKFVEDITTSDLVPPRPHLLALLGSSGIDDQVEVDASTPLLLAIPYPAGTTFSITAHAVSWCRTSSSRTCSEEFVSVDSVDHVRHSEGNTYYYDTTTSLLYVRVIQFPSSYTGDTVHSNTPTWHLWNLDTPKSPGSR